jgi:hypothetical protein
MIPYGTMDNIGFAVCRGRVQRLQHRVFFGDFCRAFLTRGTKVGRGCQAVFLRLKNAGFLGVVGCVCYPG